MKDTLTAVTGAVVPFHLSLLDEGGVSKLVLGYAHWDGGSSPLDRKKCNTMPP